MKREDITLIAAIIVVAASVSFLAATKLFKYNQKSSGVPVVEKIDIVFPDATNDSAYTKFFNSRAIDPSQLTQIGNNNNTNPFRGTTQ